MKHALAALTAASMIALMSGYAAAQSVVPQAGPVPQVLDQTSTTDNVQVLMASAAAHTSDITTFDPTEGQKNFWIQGFTSASDYISWQVSAQAASSYQLTALVNSAAGQTFAVSVNGSPAITFTADGVFDKIVAGNINLSAGVNTITITRTGALSGDALFKSIELLQSSAISAYNARVAAARSDTTWLSQAPYGVMFSYGAWGFPDNVGPAKSLNQQAADFDVPTFVNKIGNSGASYVIWAISWWTYHMDTPLASPDAIVTAAGGGSSPGLTSSRDLIGEVAAALHAKGIRFGLYYHTGDDDPAWWPYQNYPTGFSATGIGDRRTFIKNWKQVVTEIGNRYGTNLDAFFFDDGVIYYPSPFESMEAAAKTGNPARLISYNPYILPRFTDFQDVYFGEDHYGEPQTGSAPAGGAGIFVSGPYQGLLQHGMYMMDANDWGVNPGSRSISDRGQSWSQNLISAYQSAHPRQVPVSWDIMMFEDGTLDDMDLNNFNNLRQVVYPLTYEPIPTGTTMVDDTNATITYSGTGWATVTGRSGEYDGTLHYTSNIGDSFSYTFNGTGLDVIGPTTFNAGAFSVTVDGVAISNYSAVGSPYTSQQVIYSARHLAPGSHTVSLSMVNGTYFQLDALRVIPNPVTLNDTDASLTYTGSWGYSSNRGAGDYNNDVHYATANGASVSTTFTGTGVTVYGPMDPQQGTANILVDGNQVSTVQATYSGAYTPQQHYWGIQALAPGTHTLSFSKTGGDHREIDKIVIAP